MLIVEMGVDMDIEIEKEKMDHVTGKTQLLNCH